MNFEDELKTALRREPPRQDLTPKVLARLRAPQPRQPRRSWQWALAAAVVVLLAGFGWLHQQQAQQHKARVAAQQLAAALHLASNELTAVRTKVVRTP